MNRKERRDLKFRPFSAFRHWSAHWLVAPWDGHGIGREEWDAWDEYARHVTEWTLRDCLWDGLAEPHRRPCHA